MDPTIDVQSTVLERIQRSSKEQLRTVQHYFDRRHLEASLASLLQAANGHEGRGLAPGSALYPLEPPLFSWLPRIIRYLAVPSSLVKLLKVLKREEV